MKKNLHLDSYYRLDIINPIVEKNQITMAIKTMHNFDVLNVLLCLLEAEIQLNWYVQA